MAIEISGPLAEKTLCTSLVTSSIIDLRIVARGIVPEHLHKLREFASEFQLVIILREGNPNSLPYIMNGVAQPKPSEIKLKSRAAGELAGLVTLPQPPIKEAMDAVRYAVGRGYFFDERGILTSPDLKMVVSDYDLQGVYGLTKSGESVLVDSQAPSFQNLLNNQIGLRMFTHGANDNYRVVGNDGRSYPGRYPQPTERFIAVSKKSIEFIDSPNELEDYYRDQGFVWPYD
jgi:hypothetical protein